MSNVLEFVKIRDKPDTTICVKCVNFKNVEAEDSCRSKIWYNQLCSASPLSKKINFVTGEEEHYTENDNGKAIFTDREYEYCQNINDDGKCKKYVTFEDLKPTE